MTVVRSNVVTNGANVWGTAWHARHVTMIFELYVRWSYAKSDYIIIISNNNAYRYTLIKLMVDRLFASLTPDQRLRSFEIIKKYQPLIFSHIRSICVDIPLTFIQQVRVDGHRNIVTSLHHSGSPSWHRKWCSFSTPIGCRSAFYPPPIMFGQRSLHSLAARCCCCPQRE